MAETKPEFRKVNNIADIPLNSLVNEHISIGYVSPGKCRRYYTANLLAHDKKYVYMGSGDNHMAMVNFSDMHWLGRVINGVHRFRKSEIDVVLTLEAKLHYGVSRA